MTNERYAELFANYRGANYLRRYRSSSSSISSKWERSPISNSSRDFIHSLIDEVYKEASSFLMEEKLEDAVEDVDPDQLEKLLNKEFVYG